MAIQIDKDVFIPNKHFAYKALSVRQPYASLIAKGKKVIELRKYNTDYRGKIIICSTVIPKLSNHKCGYAICMVEIYDCVISKEKDRKKAFVDANYDMDCYSWLLKNPVLINPIFVRGNQKIFNLLLNKDIEYLKNENKLFKKLFKK